MRNQKYYIPNIKHDLLFGILYIYVIEVLPENYIKQSVILEN